MLWYDFLGEFNSDKNIKAKVTKYATQLATPWSRNYEGGFEAYIDMIATAFSGMDIEDPDFLHHSRMTESLKRSFLQDKFTGTPLGKDTYETFGKPGTFEGLLDALKTWYIYNYSNAGLEQARRKAMKGTTESDDIVYNTLLEESERVALYTRQPSTGRPPNPYHIPQEAIAPLTNINKGLPSFLFALRRYTDQITKDTAAGKEAASHVELPEFEKFIKWARQVKKERKHIEHGNTTSAPVSAIHTPNQSRFRHNTETSPV
jgi:hypothetical protein